MAIIARPTPGSPGQAAPRWTIALLGAVLLVGSTPAQAIPSFAQQTGQPCEACHVGAFGPQLKPYGRDFKLFGFQSASRASRSLPIAIAIQSSITHTNADQRPAPAPHFGPNNNVTIDEVSLFYGGRAPQGWGIFGELDYSGVDRALSLGEFDLRRASEFLLFGRDALAAVDVNNNPTGEDPWNSTPAWGFPYIRSSLAPGPRTATLIDGGLAGRVIGAGGYVLWNNTVYIDATAFAPLERKFAGRLGVRGDSGADRFTGPIPYVRIALLRDLDPAQTRSIEIGGYALRARRYPGGDASHGADTLSDWAVDANYQYVGEAGHTVSAHATYIREDQDLAASAAVSGSRRRNRLSTARADISYSFKDTWTPSLQVFATTGTADPAVFGAGARTSGYIAELAYSPWGKANSPVYWINARTALQYVHYTEFNGDHRHTRGNDTLYLSAWLALAPNGQKAPH